MDLKQKRDRLIDRAGLIWLGLLFLFSAVMIAFRLRYTHTPYYRFLYWNLFLAWLPLLFAQIASRLHHHHSSRWRLSLTLFLWLIFFPNAPYLMTDLMHLGYLNQMPRWYDPLMVFSAAIAGLFSGFISLYQVELIFEKQLKLWIREGVIFLICFLSSIGIYLGRVLRWNSWDLFCQPLRVFQDIAEPFLKPGDFPRSLGLIVLYSIFLFLFYNFWKSNQAKPIS